MSFSRPRPRRGIHRPVREFFQERASSCVTWIKLETRHLQYKSPRGSFKVIQGYTALKNRYRAARVIVAASSPVYLNPGRDVVVQTADAAALPTAPPNFFKSRSDSPSCCV
jgi:hypothetical protein